MKYPRSILLMIVLILLSACSSLPTAIKSPETTSTSVGYPAPQNTSPSPAYPTSEQTAAAPSSGPTITSAPNTGSVDGYLFLKSKPLENVTLYLANLVKDPQGRELVAGYDRTGPLHGSTDGNGYFIIQNVPPGRYGLVLDLVTLAYLMDKPDGSASILMTVNAGEVTHLDKLDYTELKGLN